MPDTSATTCGVLVFPNLAACRRVAGAADDAPAAEVLAHAACVIASPTPSSQFSAAQAGSSTRVQRALLLDEPPSIDAARSPTRVRSTRSAVLRHRAALVDALYGDTSPALRIDAARRTIDA